MDLSSMAVNPVAESAAASVTRKASTLKESPAKQTQQALDPSKKGERQNRAAERREEGRGLRLDIRA
jgi:hypothetical protein